MNWERLKTFYRIVQCGSLKKTAELNNITPSALSKSMKLLEEELNITLFVRHDKGLKLTQTGQEFYKYVANIQKNVNHALEAIRDNQNLLKGQIRIIAPPGFSAKYLSNYIADFLVDYPEISLTIESSKGKNINQLLESDVLIHSKLDNLIDYEQTLLTKLHLKLYASQSYIDKYGYPNSLTDFKSHKLIALSKTNVHPHLDFNWYMNASGNLDHKKQIISEVDETFGLCILAAKGVGIISIPKEHPDIKTYNLIELLPHIQGPTCSYYLITEKGTYGLKRIKAFQEYLLQRFK